MRFNQVTRPNRITADVVGSSFGVDRIYDEPVYDYVTRVYDRYRNPDGTSYDGLVSRISRKLGLSNFYPIEIDLREYVGPISIDGVIVTVLENSLTDSTQAWTDDEFVGKILQISGVNYEIIENDATTLYVNSVSLESVVATATSPTYTIYNVTNPMVLITQSRIRLYSNFINAEISEIDFEMELDKYTMLNEVVDQINSNSPSFIATELPIRKYMFDSLTARNLIPQNSITFRTTTGANARTVIFGVNNVVDDTIVMGGNGILQTKKQTIEDVVSPGDYYIDRVNGRLYTGTVIADNLTIDFRYNQFPFRPKASLVIIDDIRDSEYNRMLFSQVPQECYANNDGQFKNGKPLDQFFYDYRLLQKMNNIHWGK